MKNVAANSQRQRFTKSLPHCHVDPTIRLEAVVQAIHHSFVKHDFALPQNSISFETAREAILELLRVTSELNEETLWDADWDLPVGYFDPIPEPFQGARRRKLVNMRKLLRSESATKKSFVRAMEIVDEAITSMRMEFAFALIPEGGLDKAIIETQRYKCAAILGSIEDLLSRLWRPIRDKCVPKAVGEDWIAKKHR